MARLLSDADIARFRSVHRDAADTFHQKIIIWRKLKSTMDRYGEDNQGNGYVDIELKALLNYNYMRSWPVNYLTETGDLDRQSVQILMNKDYLSEMGYLNSDGLLDYDPSQDLIIIDGLPHKPVGDTPVSQNYNDDILFTMIVKRDEGKTSNVR